MSKAARSTVRQARVALEFERPAQLTGFLLTCLGEAEFSRGTQLFDQHLNHVYIRRAAPHTMHLRVTGKIKPLKLLLQMAEANGGKGFALKELANEYLRTNVQGLLARIRLQPARLRQAPDQLLFALWECSTERLQQIVLHLTELTASWCEVAFIKAEGDVPTHLIRLHTPAHTDAVLTWVGQQQGRAEVYTPYRSEGAGCFYVQSGYRYPLPGLDQLSDLSSELVLLGTVPQSKVTRWLAFPPGQLNFFRRFHEISDPNIEVERQPFVKMGEGAQPHPLPLEIAIAPQPAEGPMRLWQLDKLIDQQREKLLDLEKRRQILATGRGRDVFFAYKFVQRGADRLNPLLVRFCQQRLGVLANYDYAYCAPQNGEPFHLIVARQTQRDLGFGMQLADAVYYQPEQYRQWGVNLFLPIGRRMIPAVASSDAIPLLQQLLEKIGSHDAEALIWEDLGQGRIAETRITETQPLLSQYRLLNSFQRTDARQVVEQTRQGLIDELRHSRREVAVTCRSIEQDILTYVEGRCEQLELTYAELHEHLTLATADITEKEPKIEKVTEFIQSIPETWAKFVQAVLDLHRQLTKDRIEAHDALRETYRFSRETLRAAAVRHKDLNAKIVSYKEKVAADGHVLKEDLNRTQATIAEARAINGKLYALFIQIRAAYDHLSERIQAITAAQQKADHIQAAIDSVDKREREAQARLERLQGLEEQIAERVEKLKVKTAHVQAGESDAASKLAEVAQAEEDMFGRLRDASRSLADLERHLARVVADAAVTEELFCAIQEESELLQKRAGLVQRWEQHASRWSEYLTSEHQQANERAARVREGDGNRV